MGYWKQELSFLKKKVKEILFRICYSKISARKKYIMKKFHEYLDYSIDFTKQPKTFNQKIQFRKLYDYNPLYNICSDKFRVREYIKEKVGEEYLIPLYLVTDKLTEKQWDELPNSFVAKANHNSGPVQIIKDKSKANKHEVIRELNNQLKIDYGVLSMEHWYSKIPRKIIVEKMLGDGVNIPPDFKINIFNKKDKLFIEYMYRPDEKHLSKYLSCYYDSFWNKQNFNSDTAEIKIDVPKPNNLEKMIEIAKKLSTPFDYVRVDLFSDRGHIYVGELTFADGSGFVKFYPEEWDIRFGSYWNQEIQKRDKR